MTTPALRTAGHRRRRSARSVASLVVVAGMFVAAGCGNDEDSTTSTTDASAASTGSATAGSDGGETGSSDDGSSAADEGGAKVNANTADVSEMAAAFEAAGVPNADKWAREVEEYRPYTDDDWAHLYDELSKYNIDDDAFDKITSTLEL